MVPDASQSRLDVTAAMACGLSARGAGMSGLLVAAGDAELRASSATVARLGAKDARLLAASPAVLATVNPNCKQSSSDGYIQISILESDRCVHPSLSILAQQLHSAECRWSNLQKQNAIRASSAL